MIATRESEDGPIDAVAFSSNGKLVVIGNQYGQVTLWDPIKGVFAMDDCSPLKPHETAYNTGVSHLELVTIIVADYDPAIAFFVDILGFELVDDSPSVSTNTGQPKRWVVVRPPNARTGILLARADNATQLAAVGNQMAGRVGFFLRVDDFAAQYARMCAAGVAFVGEPREEPYGRVVVFQDLCGNRWDLLST